MDGTAPTRDAAATDPAGVAVLFPGQGSQVPGMADPWLEHEAGATVLEIAADVLGRDVAAGCRDEALLATTGFVQPALLACDVAAFRVLQARGIAAGAAAGHSLGELAALAAAGAMDLRDALEVVRVRGRAMQEAADRRPGAMTALIGPSTEEAEELCIAARGDGVLAVANENAPNQHVLSGSVDAIERAEEEARRRRARAIRLNVAGAFHSPLMQPAVDAIREVLAATEIREPAFPVVANVTATIERDPQTIRELLARHVVSPVRWDRSTRVLAEAGFATFVEAGPGEVLTRLARRALGGVRAVAVGSPADVEALELSVAAGEEVRS
ncbi:MAG: ACP S-malonyltransferase [Candidatus Velamenicoccus archaeovorus]